MSARHEAMGAKAVDDYHRGGRYRKDPPSHLTDEQAAAYRKGANDRQSAYGSGHDMTHHSEGKKHGEK